MAEFSNKAGWMEFPRLTVSAGLTSTYTLAWKMSDDSAEAWTERFIRFKAEDRKAYFGAARLVYHAFPSLLDAMKLKGKDCAFVSALSSSEAAVDVRRQVPYIVSQLADTVGAHCAISALTKQPHGKIHKLSRPVDRDSELAKAQYSCGRLPAQNVFVFDDFVTRGSTLSLIAQTIHGTNPDVRVFGVALAKPERLRWNSGMNNNHLPAGWDKVWTDGEGEVQ